MADEHTSDKSDADERAWARDKAYFVANAGDHSVSGPGSGPLMAEVTALTQALLNTTTVAGVLEHVVDAARRIVPGADLVSITLRSPDGAFHTPIETGPVAIALDQLQYETGEGPCVTAARLSGPGHIRCDDLRHEPAWPRFAPAAADHGFTAVLSTTLLPDAKPPRLTGALNIYARHRDVLQAEAQDTALLLATHASLALAGAQAVSYAELKQRQLQQALESRDVIGQAKGILMNRRGCTAEEAFDLLRRTSQDLNVKLAELATTLAVRHTELDPPQN